MELNNDGFKFIINTIFSMAYKENKNPLVYIIEIDKQYKLDFDVKEYLIKNIKIFLKENLNEDFMNFEDIIVQMTLYNNINEDTYIIKYLSYQNELIKDLIDSNDSDKYFLDIGSVSDLIKSQTIKEFKERIKNLKRQKKELIDVINMYINLKSTIDFRIYLLYRIGNIDTYNEIKGLFSDFNNIIKTIKFKDFVYLYNKDNYRESFENCSKYILQNKNYISEQDIQTAVSLIESKSFLVLTIAHACSLEDLIKLLIAILDFKYKDIYLIGKKLKKCIEECIHEFLDSSPFINEIDFTSIDSLIYIERCLALLKYSRKTCK